MAELMLDAYTEARQQQARFDIVAIHPAQASVAVHELGYVEPVQRVLDHVIAALAAGTQELVQGTGRPGNFAGRRAEKIKTILAYIHARMRALATYDTYNAIGVLLFDVSGEAIVRFVIVGICVDELVVEMHQSLPGEDIHPKRF
ncbi:MAG: hypothetical protein ABSD30_03335 [Candidatus Binatus sp.]